MSLRVRTPGLFTTVQDLGRRGTQRDGIPAGGAMDAWALRVGNLLVGNPEDAAGLEATLIGPAIEFAAPALIAVTGADLGATIDERALPPWHPAVAPAGAMLHFGRPRAGCRAYLCIAGGVDVAPVFGSRSTYVRASFGGLEGRALRAGDELPVGAPAAAAAARIEQTLKSSTRATVARWSAGYSLRPRYGEATELRFIDGEHTALLSDASRAALVEQSFRASASSDRMGYRLEGQPLTLERPVELLSEAVAMGTLQLPPGGAPILLMADRQTTGGYPRIGEVATIDLSLAAQLRPGDAVRFGRISLADAQRLYLARERDLEMARVGFMLALARGAP